MQLENINGKNLIRHWIEIKVHYLYQINNFAKYSE